jgi:hypothetical protein
VKAALSRTLSDTYGGVTFSNSPPTGPVRPSDTRLRRAQSLSHHSGVALQIAKELINQKLIGQGHLVHKHFPNSAAASAIANARKGLTTAKSSDEIRVCESQGALAYWTAWRELSVTFPRMDLARVPEHWRVFGSRLSPPHEVTSFSREPAECDAQLSICLARIRGEACSCCTRTRPGIGVLHNDSRTRDSLACDLMEPIRPQVDAFLLDWLSRSPLRREWFFEQRDGNCRLMGSLAERLSETSDLWARAVAPFAEGIARALWSMTSKRARTDLPATRLTQSRKREAKGIPTDVPIKSDSRPPAVCRNCGLTIKPGFKYCRGCVPEISRENVREAAKRGRLATHSSRTQARRADTQRRQAAALKAWSPTDKPEWLDEQAYRERIQPRLASTTVPTSCLHSPFPNPTR